MVVIYARKLFMKLATVRTRGLIWVDYRKPTFWSAIKFQSIFQL